MSGVRQPAPYRLAAKTTAAATTSNAASPAGAITPSSAPAPADSQQGPDTVELHDKTGAGRLPPFVFNPHFDATVGEGETCELGVHADLLIANDYELHWPFQFLQNGDGFSVVSLDHPEPSSTQGTFGPVHYAKGFTDPSNYTVYSGFGFSSALNAAVTCHLDTPFGRISIPFGVGYGNISLGSVNKTLHHVRLSGDPGGDLQIPPDHCGGASETFGPTNIGIEVCQYQTLGPGLVRATMTGTGGKPQGIAVSYSNGDFVHHGTAPNGGAIRVDQFNYAAPLTVRMVAGLLLNIDPRPFLPFKKGRGASAAQKKAGVFSAAQRHKNQVGPTLPNGHWHDAKNQWYDERENKTSEPADPLGELQRANANWFHPGQDGPTLRDGRFRLKSGGNNPWRNPNGTTAKTPTPQELADYNPLTNSDPSEEEPKATPDDLHGWTYSTTEGDLIAPGNANPASLLLNLPVQPAPAPPPCSKQAARQELATRGLLGSGFTGVATVICGDFSGDGGVAMAFTREVTGSAGTIGWGVFVAEGRKWRLAFVREHETQVGIKAQGRELLRSQPIHRPGDANCCPTGGATIEAYRFRGGTFVKIGESHDPNPHPAGFYVLGPTP